MRDAAGEGREAVHDEPFRAIKLGEDSRELRDVDRDVVRILRIRRSRADDEREHRDDNRDAHLSSPGSTEAFRPAAGHSVMNQPVVVFSNFSV